VFVLITFHNLQRTDYVVRGMFATHEAAEQARKELVGHVLTGHARNATIEIAKILGVHK
jgi:L-lactate utilization protein LutC